MRYKFYSNSEKSWKAMYESISNAKDSVYLEMYIFDESMDKYDFLELVKEKARAGVRVRIILDSLGSRELSKDAVAKLKLSGAEVFFISYFFHHTHRKVLILDEKVAFIGGVNFTKHSSHWDDLVVKVEGKRIVKHIINSFAKVYITSGGNDPKIKISVNKNKKIIIDKTKTWLIEHFPVAKKFTLKKIYKEHISNAKESVVLITPYFVPKRWFIALLHQAVLRGVRVEVLVPNSTDHFVFIDKANYYFISKLTALGVKFYIEPHMNHAKAMIIDSSEAIVGSHNLDFLSFDYNDEIGVFLKDQNAINRLESIVAGWKKASTLFEQKNQKPSYVYYLLSPFIRIFARII